MAGPNEFISCVLELLKPMGSAQTSRFFGGVALKLHGHQFGMAMNRRLYFVVDDRTRPGYVQAGSQPFSYETKKARVDVRRYFEVPADALEDLLKLRAMAMDTVLVAGR